MAYVSKYSDMIQQLTDCGCVYCKGTGLLEDVLSNYLDPNYHGYLKCEFCHGTGGDISLHLIIDILVEILKEKQSGFIY